MATPLSWCQTLQGDQTNCCLAACCITTKALCHTPSSHLDTFSKQVLPAVDILHHAAGPT